MYGSLHLSVCLPVHVHEQEDNDVCIVTEFVRGYTLRQLARRHGGIIPERALVSKILRPCISALGHLHANGILHRDIKSDNIVMGMDGMLRLLDFGLAIDIREEIANTRAGELKDSMLVC